MKQLTMPDYVNFDETKDFFGAYVEPFKRPNDDKKDKTKKKGDVIGYVFADAKGTNHIVGNSYLIEKYIKDATPGTVYGFRFLGKQKAEKGTFNAFDIWGFESMEEAKDFFSSEE